MKNPFNSVRVWLGVVLALIGVLQSVRPIFSPEWGALIEALIGVLIVVKGMFPTTY